MVCGADNVGVVSDFILVKDGKPACTIVTAEHPTPSAQLAALELQYHVLKITGAELPIRTDAERVQGQRILIGDCKAASAMGFKGADFSPQEYLIALRPAALILIGRDWIDTPANRCEQGRELISSSSISSLRHRIDYWKIVGRPERSIGEIELPGIFDDQGTCYAVYDFLERFGGVRWYGPSDANIVWPSRKTLTVRGKDIRRSLALKHRNALLSACWPFLKGQWNNPSQQEVFLYWRRLRLGGEKWAGNHTIFDQTIKTIFNNPEYQAQGPGRGSQLCYTNPQLVKEVAQKARDFFDGKGELAEGLIAMGDYFSVVPNDNSNWCTCKSCQALLAKGKDRNTGLFSSGTVSEYWFSFVNAAARELRKTHPNKYIATLAYWNYAYPPKEIEIEPNVSIALCLHVCFFANSPKLRQNDLNLYQDWMKTTKAPKFMWVYYHHPMELALIQNWKCFPNFMVHESARAMQTFIRDGFEGIFMCGEPDQLEYYILIKLWQDPSQDAEALLNEFFASYFGNAAKPMKEFYLRIEEISSNPNNYPAGFSGHSEAVAWDSLGTAERMEELGKLMAQAQSLASTDLEKKRVALWHDAIWKWMVDGRTAYLRK